VILFLELDAIYRVHRTKRINTASEKNEVSVHIKSGSSYMYSKYRTTEG